MKIHVAQKGDTLFKLAKYYNLEIEELIQNNQQLATPDDIFPGMKITIPTKEKQVNIANKTDETHTQHMMKRPIGEMAADDIITKQINLENITAKQATHPVEREQITNQHQEDSAFTRQEGGMRDVPVRERPLINPPQLREEFSYCDHCHQPIHHHK